MSEPPRNPQQQTTPPASAAPLLVDGREAARLLGLSPRTVWQLTRDGSLLAVRVGRAVRYSVRDLATFISERTTRGR